MSIVFFTGFPGFLGSELLPRILQRSPDCRAVCLVQRQYAADAQARLERIESHHPSLRGRTELVTGDITQPNLGLEDAARLLKQASEIFHLAAVYELSVSQITAMRVNVEGTRNVLGFAANAHRLDRLHYVSTCFVSGRYAGCFREDDLVKGQSFHNWYEKSKYLAELEVQRCARGGLPVTIYRPAIVVGDSRTGITQKYDGPYFAIRWLCRQPRIAVMPVVGPTSATQVNLVPRDFVVDAIACLSGLPASAGRVYQLADPHPLTVGELIEQIGRAAGRKVIRVPVPRIATKFALQYVPGCYRLTQIPAAVVDYFVHPTVYTCVNTLADLEGSGVKVPGFASYVDRIVDFVQRHPTLGPDAKAG
jgi:thioester reductase-like protein